MYKKVAEEIEKNYSFPITSFQSSHIPLTSWKWQEVKEIPAVLAERYGPKEHNKVAKNQREVGSLLMTYGTF